MTKKPELPAFEIAVAKVGMVLAIATGVAGAFLTGALDDGSAAYTWLFVLFSSAFTVGVLSLIELVKYSKKLRHWQIGQDAIKEYERGR